MNELGLVVEDDMDLAIIFSEALQAAGFQVETARDGQTARNLLLTTEPKVVILDLHLPVVDGPSLFEQIRADPRLKETIVVVATADARLAEAYQDQADFVLVKPISFTQLRDLTQRLHRE
ncbi:MAG: response regulator [Anaerolineales bacterium]